MAYKTARHPVSGMEMLVGQTKVIFENGVVCTVPEYEDTLDMSTDEFDARMRSWEKVGEHYQFDFRYAVTTGVIRRKAHYVPQTKVVPVNQEVNAPAGTDVELVPDRTSREHEGDFDGAEPLGSWVVEKAPEPVLTPQSVIFCVMSVVGLLAALMSAYHTAMAMQAFGRPLAVGIVTGAVMVLFSATSFTAARWFLSEKGAVRSFAALFAALGVLVISYSMLSTLTVNYGAWQDVSETEQQAEVSGSAELDSYTQALELAKESLARQRAEVGRLSEEGIYWRSRNWKKADAVDAELKEARQKEEGLMREYSSLLSRRPEVVRNVQEGHEDVFSFLSSFFGWDPRTLRLFMQAVPAMFFDIIAPFALSCAVYLAEKKRRTYGKTEDD